jgi:pimeloyl-ACP methyl ester carboxylesterase
MTSVASTVRLHYEIFGDGEPLLWLHGFFGAGADWRYVFEEPPGGYRLIAPDLRGHGRSPNPSDAFTFGEAAADVLELLDRLGVTRVKAIGLSGGGITLLHMATRRPDLVSAMVLVSAPPHYPAGAQAIMRQSSESMFTPAERESMRIRHPGGEAQLSRLIDDCRRLPDHASDVQFTGEVLRTIMAETLIVFGDRDPLYPASLATELYAGIPQAYLWIVPNAGHGPIFGNQAMRFREMSLAFLRGEWRPAQGR